jgi:hypothetical protein
MCDSLGISEPIARKTMTELKVTGLVEDITEKTYHAEMTVKLLPEFDWFLEPKFKELKDKMFKDLATYYYTLFGW